VILVMGSADSVASLIGHSQRSEGVND